MRVLRRGPERLDLDLDVGPGGSLLVVQRALLIYRASIDGRPAPPLPSDRCTMTISVHWPNL